MSGPKNLSFFLPSTSPITALKVIREFFSTENDVCFKAREIANILNANKSVLTKKFKDRGEDIEEIIKLYNNLSINIFDLSPGFSKIYLKNNASPCVEDWVNAIYEIVNSEAYQKRLRLLKAATVKYPAWNKIVAEIVGNDMPLLKEVKKKETFRGEAKKRETKQDTEREAKLARSSLKQNFSIPIFRTLRMKMLFAEIQKNYTNNNSKTVEQLNKLISAFEEHTAHLNACMDDPRASDQLTLSTENTRDTRRHARQLPKTVVRHFQESGNSFKDNTFLQLLENHSQNNSLTVSIILSGLNGITDPKEKLEKLERAFGAIRIAPVTPGQQHQGSHLFRKDLLYTDAQLKQIALLKAAYLEIVAVTPRIEGSAFEKYLEVAYPKTATADHGGLLAFNTTSVSWFVKTDEKTTSMKLLEKLKEGIGRINSSPEKNVAAKIGVFERMMSVAFS